MPQRGEVWLVDLGLAAKIRPCLVLGVPQADEDRALITAVPHTPAVRGTRYEISIPVRFLRDGAFDAQGIVTVSKVRLMRRMGNLSSSQLKMVQDGVCLWLGITVGS